MPQRLNVGSQGNRGFTIVEIMTVVAIATILVIVAVPGYQTMMRNNEAVTMASRLVASLRVAQGEAIKLGIPVTICPINSSFNPTTAFNETIEEWPCQNITAWNAWKVFSDPDFNATENFSNGWPIIEYIGNIQEGSITSNIAGPITFDPMGFTNIDPTTTRSGWTWSDSYSSGEWQWSYSYTSGYGGTYYRAFTITPSGCTGNNGRIVTITQNGVITTTNAAC